MSPIVDAHTHTSPIIDDDSAGKGAIEGSKIFKDMPTNAARMLTIEAVGNEAVAIELVDDV